jgi:hypothetical protein
MATLVEARGALAAALNTVEGLAVRDRPGVRAPKPGDGWVTVTRMVPSGITRTAVTLTAVVVLGADEALAEDLLDEWSVAALVAATTADFPADDTAVELTAIVVEATPLFALTITITTETEAPR